MLLYSHVLKININIFLRLHFIILSVLHSQARPGYPIAFSNRITDFQRVLGFPPYFHLPLINYREVVTTYFRKTGIINSHYESRKINAKSHL
jgi:hypothetical protein